MVQKNLHSGSFSWWVNCPPFFRNPLDASCELSPTAPHGKLCHTGDLFRSNKDPKNCSANISSPWNLHPNSSMTKWREIKTYLNGNIFGNQFSPYQVYGPCILLVVISWVSFWLNREATSDRISLGKIVNSSYCTWKMCEREALWNNLNTLCWHCPSSQAWPPSWPWPSWGWRRGRTCRRSPTRRPSTTSSSCRLCSSSPRSFRWGWTFWRVSKGVKKCQNFRVLGSSWVFSAY